MTPEQRKALPEAVRFTLEAAQIRRLAPTTQVATVVESAQGNGEWLVLGSFIDPDTNEEVSTRNAVTPRGEISELVWIDGPV